MDYQAEQHFVQTFIRKNRRERLLFELTSPAKRYNGISRFCHQAEDLLDPAKIIMKGNGLHDLPGLQRFIHDNDEICTVLSPQYGSEGRQMVFEDAVNTASLIPDAFLILGSTFAAVFTEPGKGGREIFVLSESADTPRRNAGR